MAEAPKVQIGGPNIIEFLLNALKRGASSVLEQALGNPSKPIQGSPTEAQGNFVPQVQASAPPQMQPQAPAATPQPTPMEMALAMARNPNAKKMRIPESVNSALRMATEKYKVNPTLLYDIALQESTYNPNAVNTTPEGKQAGNPKGLFQFTDPTWQTVLNYQNMPGSSLKLPNTDRFDPQTNALAAAYLISKGQLGRWDASKDVWGDYYKEEELKPYYAQTLNYNR